MLNVHELKSNEDCDSQFYISGCTCISGYTISGSVFNTRLGDHFIFPVPFMLHSSEFVLYFRFYLFRFQRTVRGSCGLTGDSVGASDPRSSVRDP